MQNFCWRTQCLKSMNAHQSINSAEYMHLYLNAVNSKVALMLKYSLSFNHLIGLVACFKVASSLSGFLHVCWKANSCKAPMPGCFRLLLRISNWTAKEASRKMGTLVRLKAHCWRNEIILCVSVNLNTIWIF